MSRDVIRICFLFFFNFQFLQKFIKESVVMYTHYCLSGTTCNAENIMCAYVTSLVWVTYKRLIIFDISPENDTNEQMIISELGVSRPCQKKMRQIFSLRDNIDKHALKLVPIFQLMLQKLTRQCTIYCRALRNFNHFCYPHLSVLCHTKRLPSRIYCRAMLTYDLKGVYMPLQFAPASTWETAAQD